jgi:uncharacterized protein YcnI
MSTNHRVREAARFGLVVTAAGVAVLLSGGVAAAHVTARVIGETATQGGYTKITFRVPNEDATAGTIKLEIKLPADHPIASLSTKQVPGWTAQVTKAKLAQPIKTDDAEISEAVSTVTWTANPGVRIAPGEFAEFEVSGGPMPETDKLVIPALQTYEGGRVVSWTEAPPAAGAAEPEHPAPVVALAAKSAKSDDHMADAPASGNSQPVANAANTSSSASTTDTTARWLGGIGLAVGALGLGFGAGATLRARRAVAPAKAGDGS